MTKRLLSFALTLVVVFGACLASFPSLSAFASFKNGDVITITGKEGGGVFYAGGYYGGPGGEIPPYFVSAMNATDRTNTANYFVWCASYGVNMPQPGREYVLYGFGDNQKNVTVNNQVVCRVNPATQHYEYLDTGLNKYIDFNWAMSCIKAAESKDAANTTALSYGWRMAVELAIRVPYFDDFEGSVEEIATDAFFGGGVTAKLTPVFGNDEISGGSGVANFIAAVKNIVDIAKKNPVTWTPYADEITFSNKIRDVYRGDYLILYEATLNKYGCSLVETYRTVYDPGTGSETVCNDISATLSGNVLTIKIPRNKLKNGHTYRCDFAVSLPAGLNYNMMYGIPSEDEPLAQNIMVYEVNDTTLYNADNCAYTPYETADITLTKIDGEGTEMSGVEFTLYNINSDNSITKVAENYIPVRTTDSSGGVTWNDLPLGKYFLVESGKPTGYADPDWFMQYTVQEGDGERKLTTTEVPVATYNGIEGIVVELIGGTVMANVVAINEKVTSDIVVDKIVTDDSSPQNYKFTLYPVNADGTLGAGTPGRTDPGGTLIFQGLPFGTYFLVENSSAGYLPYKPNEWQIDGAVSAEYTKINGKSGWKIVIGKESVWVFAVNHKVDSYISVEKVDTDGNPIQGVTFDVCFVANGTITPDGVFTRTTDGDGKFIMDGVPYGEYFVVEKASKGQTPYKPQEWVVAGPKSATYTTLGGMNGWLIVLDEDHQHATIKAVNTIQTGRIGIEKYGEAGLLEGDVFKFRITSDNSPALDQIITLTTDFAESVAIGEIRNLPIFKADGTFITYTIEEIEAPLRYEKADPISFTFEEKVNASPENTTVYTHAVAIPFPTFCT